MTDRRNRRGERLVNKGLLKLRRKSTLRAAGLMSGTSADGVDAAVIDLAPGGAGVLAFDTVPYAPSLRRRIFDLFDPAAARVDELCHLNFVLGEVFAEALIGLARRRGIALDSIDVIGSHGQTVCHLPRPRRFGRRAIRSTLQIAEPSIIAERTGVTTVADFRPRDIAAGGQGAPLVAYADFRLLTHRRRSRAVQNLGGIANVTYLPAGGRIEQVVAFDTGPGNMVLDRGVFLATGGRRASDAGGKLAARGAVLQDLLADLMRHPYLRRRPPKTTGREEFGRGFADDLYRRAVRGGARPEDIAATAVAFTVRSIADAYRRFLPGPVDEVILCGGGARNPVLAAGLTEALGERGAAVVLIDDLGISADAKEAVSFAVLACETLRGTPNNVPSATGAEHPVVLGKIIPA